jgi:hypothetical protein
MRRPTALGPVLRPFHAGLALAALLAGCTVNLDDPPSGGDGDGDGDAPTIDAATGDGDGDGVDASTGGGAQQLFTTTVQPLFDVVRPLGKCTLCHETSPVIAPKFLGANEGEQYATLTANPRWVPADPAGVANAILHSRGLHMGDAFCTAAGEPEDYCTQDEKTLVITWLEAEAAAAAQ